MPFDYKTASAIAGYEAIRTETLRDFSYAARQTWDELQLSKRENRSLRREIKNLQGEIDVLKSSLLEAEAATQPVVDGNTSDGYHTFNELYDFRKAYNAAFFNELHANNKCSVHKSWRHHDNELCFGGGWFIVVAVLPTGQISNHYEAKDWNLFAIPETEKALVEFDGHTGKDVVERLNGYTPQPVVPEGYRLVPDEFINVLDDAPYINPSNYDHDQVCELNTAVIYALSLLSAGKGG
jgi:hypothetical protein